MKRGSPVFWLLHVGLITAALTGVFLFIAYLLPPPGEFDLVHPWAIPAKMSHVLVVPLLAMGIGGVWYSHAWLFWKLGIKDGKWSGIIMLLLALPMIGSGYALQVVVSDGWKTGWLWMHWICSAIWVLAYAGHWWIQRCKARACLREGGPTK